MLVVSHVLPPLCRAERRAIAELWEQALRARHPLLPVPPPAQGLDDDAAPAAVAPGKRAAPAGKRAMSLLSCSAPLSAAGTGESGAGKGATALELVVSQVLRAVAAAAPVHAGTSRPRFATGEAEHVGAMWTRVLELVEAQVSLRADALRACPLAHGDRAR